LAFVTSCGGDPATWERRWRLVARHGVEAQPRGTGPAPTAPPPPSVPAPAQADTGPTQRGPFPRRVTRPAQLPLGPTIFVGRDPELSSAFRITKPTGQMKIPLMISGPVGVGKTAFALRLADGVAAEFPDGQLYADLGLDGPGSPSPDTVMSGFLRALGVPASLIPEDRLQRIGLYRSLLAERRLFVLLENAYDESQVRPLLSQSSHTQFVVTSSARLLGLDGMHRIDLAPLSRQESVTLLGCLTGPDRIQTEDEAADAIAEVCGDLPFALNIIGRKLAARPERTVGHIAALLADRTRLMDIFTVGDVTVRERYASAYQLLPALCRRTIQQLGRLGKRWATAMGLASAMDMSIDSAEHVLESLVDTGLITRADAAGRYGISTLVSVFAASTGLDTASLAFSLPGMMSRDRIMVRGADGRTKPFDCSIPAILPVNPKPRLQLPLNNLHDQSRAGPGRET